MPGAVAYNPSDPTQARFLAALAQGESGGAANALTLGVGGTDLSHAPADQYGFPQWQGFGGSHAAGEFQFQPGTWDAVAAAHGLNFSNPADQAAGAWYLAQDTYAQKTGGSLQDALRAGDLASVQSALSDVWPSVTGNAAAPGGLVDSITRGIGSLLGGGSSAGGGSAGGSSEGLLQNVFVRAGLIIVGALVVIVALWKLLGDQGVIPGPGETAKAAAKVAVLA